MNYMHRDHTALREYDSWPADILHMYIRLFGPATLLKLQQCDQLLPPPCRSTHEKCWQLYQEHNLNVKLMTLRVCCPGGWRMLALSQSQLQPWTTTKTDDFSSWQNASLETEVQQSKHIHILLLLLLSEQSMGSANRAQHETRPKAFGC